MIGPPWGSCKGQAEVLALAALMGDSWRWWAPIDRAASLWRVGVCLDPLNRSACSWTVFLDEVERSRPMIWVCGRKPHGTDGLEIYRALDASGAAELLAWLADRAACWSQHSQEQVA